MLLLTLHSINDIINKNISKFCRVGYMRKFLKTSVVAVVLTALLSVLFLAGCKPTAKDLIQPQFNSANAMEGATIINETLKKGEKADAKNILKDDKKNWTPRSISNNPAVQKQNVLNSAVEIQLNGVKTFNTAVIKEVGNEVQYFRLQIWQGGKWVDVYKSEKIQLLRVCTFNPVTTDKIRLSIDKFRSEKSAKINSIELYNEHRSDTENFNVTAYQRFDVDILSEIVKDEQRKLDYAKFYDVYNCVLIFGAVGWQGNKMVFNGTDGEEGFARELAALKEIISYRTNLDHDVKIICTTLPDGTGGGHIGVNTLMAKHWESVADTMLAFMSKYDLDGMDIDWEYPQNKDDWKCYDKFITKLDDGMKQIKPNAILSGALSSSMLGMSKDVLERFEQIQFMAYDGHDEDGYQSSLEQAQFGLKEFVEKGAKLSQINIGVAVYGRPVISAPLWPLWRDLEGKDLYWNSLHYNVICGGELVDAAYCAPALAGDKAIYALLTGAGGVMTFRLDCDKINDPNSVANGIKNALDSYKVKY